MSTIAVNVTDFSRSLSEFLNKVQYNGQTLNLERGKRVIAQVSPAGTADGFPISQLDNLLQNGPQLSSNERNAMAQDLAEVRSKLKTKTDPWAS
jgi:hypothetical protein